MFVASLYAKRGVVIHDYWSQINVMRTIEQVLGLPPMNQMDLAAEPMFDAFTTKPDFRAFDALANQIPLDEMPGVAVAAPISGAFARAWVDWAKHQNFLTQGMVDMNQLNRDIWYSTNNFTVAYPGDSIPVCCCPPRFREQASARHRHATSDRRLSAWAVAPGGGPRHISLGLCRSERFPRLRPGWSDVADRG